MSDVFDHVQFEKKMSLIMDRLINTFFRVKPICFHTYFRCTLLLMIITCIVGYLVQIIVMKNVNYVYGDNPNVTFSYWRGIVEINETIATTTIQRTDKILRENKRGAKKLFQDSFEKEFSFPSNNKTLEKTNQHVYTNKKRLNTKPLVDVKGVALEYANTKCPVDEKRYIKPFIPKLQRKRSSFAVCLKILYGNVDTKLLIDWIEFYREIKVDKVSVFVYNVTQETQSIIKHYEALGLLETRKFEFPWKTGRVCMKIPLFWEDEQVVIYDCFYRLYGYSYIAIVDLDEFLLPRKHGSIKDIMGATGRANGSDIVKYIQRTPALIGLRVRSKNILIPSRVLVDIYFYTHEFKPKPGYERFTVHESIGAINHYRSCYKNLANVRTKQRRFIDTYIFKVVNRFQNRTIW